MRSSIRVFVITLCVIASASVARASLVSLVATHDPSEANAFTLDFGQFGGEAGAQITNTDFVLDIDSESGSASFASYNQIIGSIMLPGNIPTGLITVEIKPGTSSGTFDPQTGNFTTSDTYSITTENDLTAFGLANPVLLPSTSSGNIDFLKSKISQNWAGTGQIGIEPNIFPFDYTCDVNTTFTPEPTSLALLGIGMVGLVSRRRR